MAKGKGSRGPRAPRNKAADATAASQDNVLGSELEAFKRGDFATASKLLAAKVGDDSLSQAQRERAADLLAATRPEPTAVLVGLACGGLMLLLILVLAFTQP